MIGLELVVDHDSRAPDPALAETVLYRCLSGASASPPLVISRASWIGPPIRMNNPDGPDSPE